MKEYIFGLIVLVFIGSIIAYAVEGSNFSSARWIGGLILYLLGVFIALSIMSIENGGWLKVAWIMFSVVAMTGANFLMWNDIEGGNPFSATAPSFITAIVMSSIQLLLVTIGAIAG